MIGNINCIIVFLVYVYPKLGDLSENITKYYLSLMFFVPIYFQEISKDGKNSLSN